MMLSVRAAGMLFVVVLLAGCEGFDGGDEGKTDHTPAQAGVEIGALNGETWEPLVEGAPLRIYMGLQGGYHVELSARWTGLQVEGLAVKYEVRDATTDSVLNWPVRLILDQDGATCEGGACWRGPDIVQLDGWDPQLFDGRAVKVSATVERSVTQAYTATQAMVLDY